MERGDHRRRTRIQQLLTPLRESIVDKPPYISGTLQLPESSFSFFYKIAKDGLAARYINFSNATPDELEQLAQACEPASFGVKQEHVLDETYRKAGKMDSECFSSVLDPYKTDLMKIVRGYLLEGLESKRGINAELYKLNIYSKGSFFKPHVDTPRSEKMFGSLVVVFPTPHDGGALLLRHHGHEWIFDSAKALEALDQPTIGYVAFFSDIEHEVAPVTSGHRVTLTYNLYFDDDDDGPDNTVSKHVIPAQVPNQEGFREAFKALLDNPEFMADGGTLAFGLRHIYPIERNLKHVYNVLKGSDVVVYQTMRTLGFEPVLYVYYEDEDDGDDYEDDDDDDDDDDDEEEDGDNDDNDNDNDNDDNDNDNNDNDNNDNDNEEDGDEDYSNPSRGVMVDRLMDFDDSYYDESVLDVVQEAGGIPVCQVGGKVRDTSNHEDPELLEWVTPLTVYNRKEGAFASYGNEPSLTWAYGDVCMIVRIGKAGDRLAFPTAVQVRSAYLKSWQNSHLRGYY